MMTVLCVLHVSLVIGRRQGIEIEKEMRPLFIRINTIDY
jgi:hypothetical protein